DRGAMAARKMTAASSTFAQRGFTTLQPAGSRSVAPRVSAFGACVGMRGKIASGREREGVARAWPPPLLALRGWPLRVASAPFDRRQREAGGVAVGPADVVRTRGERQVEAQHVVQPVAAGLEQHPAPL